MKRMFIKTKGILNTADRSNLQVDLEGSKSNSNQFLDSTMTKEDSLNNMVSRETEMIIESGITRFNKGKMKEDKEGVLIEVMDKDRKDKNMKVKEGDSGKEEGCRIEIRRCLEKKNSHIEEKRINQEEERLINQEEERLINQEEERLISQDKKKLFKNKINIHNNNSNNNKHNHQTVPKEEFPFLSIQTTSNHQWEHPHQSNKVLTIFREDMFLKKRILNKILGNKAMIGSQIDMREIHISSSSMGNERSSILPSNEGKSMQENMKDRDLNLSLTSNKTNMLRTKVKDKITSINSQIKEDIRMKEDSSNNSNLRDSFSTGMIQESFSNIKEGINLHSNNITNLHSLKATKTSLVFPTTPLNNIFLPRKNIQTKNPLHSTKMIQSTWQLSSERTSNLPRENNPFQKARWLQGNNS